MRDYADFDRTQGDFRPERFNELLENHPEKLSQHLLVARLIERWAKLNYKLDRHSNEDYRNGFTSACMDISLRLRQGYYLPGGEDYESLRDADVDEELNDI